MTPSLKKRSPEPVTAPDLDGLEPLAAPAVSAPMPAWTSVGVALTADQHPTRVHLAKLAPGSRGTMRQTLDDPNPSGVRHAALTVVLYGGGLQHAELTALDAKHHDAKRRDVIVRGRLQVDTRVPRAPCRAR